MFKRGVWYFIFMWLGLFPAHAQLSLNQPDTVKSGTALDTTLVVIDTASIAVLDELTPEILRKRDASTNEIWLDSLSKGYGFEVFSMQKQLFAAYTKYEAVTYQQGTILSKGNKWVLGTIGVLLLLFAVLKNAFAKQLSAVVQSFYSNRALANLNKEENLVTSWPFLLLFIQFGFTLGMFFYLVAQYREVDTVKGGFSFYIYISASVIVLYLLKILVLKFIGFVFNVQKPVHEYISILYLSYFNASLLFVPIIIAFALSPVRYGDFYALIGLAALLLIFIFQFIRAVVNILSQYKFPRLYLFLYFCTLEISPILILIKAIGL